MNLLTRKSSILYNNKLISQDPNQLLNKILIQIQYSYQIYIVSQFCSKLLLLGITAEVFSVRF